jgi:hypothetical protein
MLRFLRIYRLMEQLKSYRVFISLHVSNFRAEFEYWDGQEKVKGDEYAAKRMLRTLQENERRGLEWAEKPYPRSGRIVESKPE